MTLDEHFYNEIFTIGYPDGALSLKKNDVNAALVRLHDYESTGLLPSEIKALLKKLNLWGDRQYTIDFLNKGGQNAMIKSEWISVNDKLPQRYERVFTYDKLRGREMNEIVSDGCWLNGTHVIFWMPLPPDPVEMNE